MEVLVVKILSLVVARGLSTDLGDIAAADRASAIVCDSGSCSGYAL